MDIYYWDLTLTNGFFDKLSNVYTSLLEFGLNIKEPFYPAHRGCKHLIDAWHSSWEVHCSTYILLSLSHCCHTLMQSEERRRDLELSSDCLMDSINSASLSDFSLKIITATDLFSKFSARRTPSILGTQGLLSFSSCYFIIHSWQISFLWLTSTSSSFLIPSWSLSCPPHLLSLFL